MKSKVEMHAEAILRRVYALPASRIGWSTISLPTPSRPGARWASSSRMS